MEKLEIKVSRRTRMVDLPKQFISVEGENLQSELVFSFIDEFVDGQARLEYEIKDEKNFILLTKEWETYTVPVKNIITVAGEIDMQLVITEGTDEEGIPVFKSNKFYLSCNPSINAVGEAPDGYELWIEKANVKLNEIDNLDIDIENNIVTITKKDGTTKSENVKGDDYIITEEDYNEIETNVKSDIQPILENIENTANRAEIIAKGKSQAIVVKTFADLEEVLRDVSNKGKFNKGDDLYIEAIYTDETKKEIQPDYWVTEVLETPNEKGYYYNISELGAEKPDLTEYTKKEQFVTLTQEEYDALTEKSANTYYFIIEEE